MTKGRKPTPTNVLMLRGTHRPDRRPNNEPAPTRLVNVPKPPSHLDRIAKKEWKRLAPDLQRIGVLNRLSMATFEAYCVNYSKWREAEAFLSDFRKKSTIAAIAKAKAEGKEITKKEADQFGFYNAQIMKTQSGYQQAAVMQTESNKFQKQMQAFGSLLGLDPSSATRINLPEPKEQTEGDKYFDEEEVNGR